MVRTIAALTAAANTDAVVYWVDNDHGTSLTEVEAAIAAGSSATGQATVIVDNGTSTVTSATITGGAGADVIALAAGTNAGVSISDTDGFTLTGGTTNTVAFTSALAATTITGGSGVDTYTFGTGSNVATVTGGLGADVMDLGAAHTGGITIVQAGTTPDAIDAITNFLVADDIIDFTTNAAVNSGATVTAYAEGALGAVGATIALQAFSNNITVADSAVGPTEAEMETYLSTTAVFESGAATGALYVVVDDGTDSWLVLLESSGSNQVYTAAEDVSTVVTRLIGVTDATTFSGANFADFT